MNKDKVLKQRLEWLAGPVDRRGVWEAIEVRATRSRQARPKAAGSRLAAHGAGRKRVRLAAYVMVALAAVTGVVVGTTVGLDGGLVVFGTDDGSDGYWEKLPVAGQGGSVWTILMDPEDHDTLYNLSRDGIFKSTDGAGSWQRVLSLGNEGYYSLTLVSGPPATLLVAVRHSSSISSIGDRSSRLIKSDDGGDTWVDITDNLLSGVKREYGGAALGEIQFIRYDEAEFPGTIILSVIPQRQGLPPFWKSSDQGLTWTKLDDAESEHLLDSLLGPRLPEKSPWTDWELLKDAGGKVLGSSICAVIDPDDPSLIYAGTTSGVCRSTDGGDTWVDVSNGIDHEVGGSLVIDPVLPSTMYFDTAEGVFKSEDEGATWRQILRSYNLDDGVGGDNSVWSFVLAPSRPSTLYAWKSDGLLRSEDGGATWSKRRGDVPSELDPDEIYPSLVAVAPDDPDIVFALFYTGIGEDLFRSVDGGDSWSMVLENGGRSGLLADPNDSSILYTTKPNGYIEGADNESLAVKSVDRGATWQTVMQVGEVATGFGVALGVGDPTPLYVFDSLDLWRSLDGGASWEKVESTGLPGPMYQLICDVRSSGVLYGFSVAYTTEDGSTDRWVSRSSDGGATWVTAFETMPLGCEAITIGPGSNGSLYAYGSGGVYKWVPAEDGDAGDEPTDPSESISTSSASSGGWGCSGNRSSD